VSALDSFQLCWSQRRSQISSMRKEEVVDFDLKPGVYQRISH
jgi:hypothetical protein